MPTPPAPSPWAGALPGSPEGALWLGVAPETVEKWHERGIRPAPDWVLSGRYPAWATRTWEAFGIERGHLVEDTES